MLVRQADTGKQLPTVKETIKYMNTPTDGSFPQPIASAVLQRMHASGLPLEEVVVIGSGLLDALGLREANDIDMVVTEQLFERLSKSHRYSVGRKRQELYLYTKTTEIFMSWGSQGDIPNFTELKRNAILIDGVYFAHPNAIISEKERRGTEKDRADIALLKKWIMSQDND